MLSSERSVTFPHHFHGLGVQPLVLVGVIQAAEEQPVKAHLCKQVGLKY